MTAALPVHVALVDETGKMKAKMQALAGAINHQIQSDVAPIWKVSASVGAYTKAPANTWAVYIQNKLDEPGALGYHTDSHKQPVAYCEYTDDVSVTVSHEVMEMLVDPFGNRMHGARLPDSVSAHFKDFGLKKTSSHVQYLLEVGDPCENTSYPIGDVAVSDFLLPGWYRTTPLASKAYSHASGCQTAREVAEGGYVSFAVGDEWFQIFVEGGQPQISDLGKFDTAQFNSLREFTDYHSRMRRASVAKAAAEAENGK